MIETNDLNNNLEIKLSSLLIEEYLETRESTREWYTPEGSRQLNAVRYSMEKDHLSAKAGLKYSSNSC